MTSVYNTTAKDIIKNSIRSAIFIDDNLAVPFKARSSDAHVNFSRALYNSFTSHNVSLDFYKYSSKKDWKTVKDYFFKARDLVVLDWQLDNNTNEENTLQILEEAVNTPSLHFVCIYTAKPMGQFDDIAYAIKAYFSQYDKKIVDQPTQEIEAHLDEQLPNGLTQRIREKLKSDLKEFSLSNSQNKDDKFSELKKRIGETFGTIADEFQGEIGKKFKSKLDIAFEALGFGLSGEYLSKIPTTPYSINYFADNNFILIDNTIIIITNKSDPKPTALYSYFTDALLKSSGNFLSLLSLDLKNILRDSSGFIGKDLDMIDEVAFFYHKDHVIPKEAFFEFVLELWKSNLASMLYSQNHLIKLFNEDTLLKYREKKKIDSKIKNFGKKGNKTIDDDLARLNYYYNIIQNRNTNDFVRFGDVFNILDQSEKPTSEFLLCITAHCDCLYIENIKNQFFFVKGQQIENSVGLSEGDTGNNSFILDSKGNVICINWSNKPFTIYIEDNKLLKNKQQIIIGKGNKLIHYSATIKENYTQRISNNAFSHPMRVGIFFAKKGH